MTDSPSRFVFIHLPRTGGFSVMQAVGQQTMDIGDVTLVTSPSTTAAVAGGRTHVPWS